MANIQYSEEKSIGRGTFGKIYRVKRRDLKGSESLVAIKKIDLRKCNQKDREHAQREADVLQTCHHENLVQYFESFTKDDYLNIVMELCNRGNLRTLITDDNGLNEKQFIHILAQIVKGLKYLHDKKIIHRDVKTTNILLDERNGELNVKIGDFGLAKVMDMSSPTMNVGSPYFMSPEMMNGKEYDMKTDIWSLGCCAYEMATTFVPYETAKELDRLQRLKNEGKVDSSKIQYCGQMKDLIIAMMATEPTRRPKVEEILSLLQQHDPDTHEIRTQDGDEVIIIDVKVKMTREEADWFSKAEQLKKDIYKRLNDKGLVCKMTEALNRTMTIDNEKQFLAEMETILNGTMYKKCRPDLKALWGYQSELSKKEFKIAL